MKKFFKLVSVLLICTILLGDMGYVYAVENQEGDNGEIEPIAEKIPETVLELSASSVILMEASTGNIVYEMNGNVQMPPASVTKIMTMLLIFDAIEDGTITLDDEVVVSDYAASMGGSQVFLEVGEKQTVETMLKCIAVSSANDACVAMAEYVAGSEEAFVQKMNERATKLGMNNTTFINCNGLDAQGHLTTAYDIALMSREIMVNYPEIQDYTMIWMENITHVTNKGSSEFGLSNTNKLVRYYEYTTGLKTGYTSEAKFCISATANKNDIDMIAVVMGAPTSSDRNSDAVKLLNHGFANCQKYIDSDKIELENILVSKGVQEEVDVEVPEPFDYVDTTGADIKTIEKKVVEYELIAPIKKGDVVGELAYYLQGEKIGSSTITAKTSVEELNFVNSLKIVGTHFTL